MLCRLIKGKVKLWSWNLLNNLINYKKMDTDFPRMIPDFQIFIFLFFYFSVFWFFFIYFFFALKRKSFNKNQMF